MKERKLTKAEQRRKAYFEALSKDLYDQGYTSRHLTTTVTKANFIGLLLTLPFFILLLTMYILHNGLDYTTFSHNGPIGLLLVVVMIVIHELIHGLTWGIFAKDGFKSIEFGVIWKALTPYCTCRSPLTRGQYILGALMPTIVLGFILGGISVMTANFALCYASALLILGGAGDFLIVTILLKDHPKQKGTIYIDHPYDLGVVVFEKASA